MILPIFTDVSGLKIAINPDNVLSVANAGEKFTDINFVGSVIRVSLSFENTVARLVGARELGPE
jgi:hypothetical protein